MGILWKGSKVPFQNGKKKGKVSKRTGCKVKTESVATVLSTFPPGLEGKVFFKCHFISKATLRFPVVRTSSGAKEVCVTQLYCDNVSEKYSKMNSTSRQKF